MTDAPTDQFACQLGHATHTLHPVTVDLSRPHGYHDYTPIDASLLPPDPYTMLVWDWQAYAGGANYCPGCDVVAQTIEQLGIWEPRETAITLLALAAPPQAAPGIVVDVGAQLGWFSLLAAHRGRRVVAIDADPECTRALNETKAVANLTNLIALNGAYHPDRPRPLLPESHIRLLKVDVESHEFEVVDALWDRFANGRIDVAVIEFSPTFRDGYGALGVRIINAGYRAYALPPKRQPPIAITSIADLDPYRLDNKQRKVAARLIEEVPQQDLVFIRRGAPELP